MTASDSKRGTWIVAVVGSVAGGVAAIAGPGSARACGGDGTGLVLAGALVPSEIGVAVPTARPGASRFVLGWSWQLPVDDAAFGDRGSRHRIVAGVDLLPRVDGASWRGRLGYRYGRRHLLGGAGVGLDGAGVNLSPELGVKFAHDGDGNGLGIDLSMHVLGRAEIDPASGHVRGATVLLGWNLF